jgi:hypothetical protein
VLPDEAGRGDHQQEQDAPARSSVFDLYTRDTPRDWNAEYHKMIDPAMKMAKDAESAADKARVLGTKPSLELAKYAGTYADSMYGDLTIGQAAGGLTLKYGIFAGTLEHWNYDTFRGTMNNPSAGKPLVTFVLGADGKPVEVKIQGFEDGTFRAKPPAATASSVSLTREQLQGLVGRYKRTLPLDVDVRWWARRSSSPCLGSRRTRWSPSRRHASAWRGRRGCPTASSSSSTSRMERRPGPRWCNRRRSPRSSSRSSSGGAGGADRAPRITRVPPLPIVAPSRARDTQPPTVLPRACTCTEHFQSGVRHRDAFRVAVAAAAARHPGGLRCDGGRAMAARSQGSPWPS